MAAVDVPAVIWELRRAVESAGLTVRRFDERMLEVTRRVRFEWSDPSLYLIASARFDVELVDGALKIGFGTLADSGLSAAPELRLLSRRAADKARRYAELDDAALAAAYALVARDRNAAARAIEGRAALLALAAYDVVVDVGGAGVDVTVGAVAGGPALGIERIRPVVQSLVELWRAWGAPEHEAPRPGRAPSVGTGWSGRDPPVVVDDARLLPLRAAVDAAVSRHGGVVERVGSTWQARVAHAAADGGDGCVAGVVVAPRPDGHVVDVVVNGTVPPSSPRLSAVKRRPLLFGRTALEIASDAPPDSRLRTSALALDGLVRELDLSAPATGSWRVSASVDVARLQPALTALVDLWAALCASAR